MGILSVVLIGGFFVDLRAHNHGRVDDSFFTPWHGILYAGAGLHGGVLAALAWRGPSQGATLSKSLPYGYGLSLVGAVLFLIGGVLDLIWHSVFGIEDNIDALLSPSHLTLALAGGLMVAGPVRSAWAQGAPSRFPRWLLWVLPLTMLMSIITAFTEYAHPAIETWPGEVSDNNASSSSLLLVAADGRTQTRVPLDIGDDVWLPSFSADGRQLVVGAAAGGAGAIWILDADGSNPRLVWEGPGIFNHPALSPDGTQIAFTTEAESGNADVFVIGVNGDEPTRLTDDPGTDWGPTWTSDGKSITFVSDRDGDGDLYTTALDGGKVTQITDFDGYEGPADWSPDGSQIAFHSDVDGDTDIYTMSASGDGLVALTSNDAFDMGPTWSPDGTQIAYSSDQGDDVDLYVIPVSGGEAINLTRNAAAHDGWAGISWSADGSMIGHQHLGLVRRVQ